MSDIQWSIQEVFNEFFGTERELKPRDVIYASELGKSFRDRYYSMFAVKPTNPMETRVRMLFYEGQSKERDIMTILKITGLLKGYQRIANLKPTKKRLAVRGRIDMVAGGKIDWPKVKDKLDQDIKLLEAKAKGESHASDQLVLKRNARKVVEILSNKYFATLQELIYEIKTLNSQAFWRNKNDLTNAYPFHKLQIYSYLKATKLPEGRILYVSRDDGSLVEVPVFKNDKSLEALFKFDVETMTRYYKEKKVPPTEPWLVRGSRGYEINWKLRYSPYLDIITGCQKKDFEKVCSNLREQMKRLDKESK